MDRTRLRNHIGLTLALAIVLAPAFTDYACLPVMAAEPSPAPAEPSREAVPPPRLAPTTKVELPALRTPIRTCDEKGRDVCKPRKVGGAVLLSLGIAMLGAGVGLLVPESNHIAGEPAYERAFRPAGMWLLATSIPVGTFGAMLIGDAIQRARGSKARFARRSR